MKSQIKTARHIYCFCPFLFSFFVNIFLTWDWSVRQNGRWYQHVLAVSTFWTRAMLTGLTLWKSLFEVCVCVLCMCVVYVCCVCELCVIFVYGLCRNWLEKGLICEKDFWNVCLLMTEFDHFEVTPVQPHRVGQWNPVTDCWPFVGVCVKHQVTHLCPFWCQGKVNADPLCGFV